MYATGYYATGEYAMPYYMRLVEDGSKAGLDLPYEPLRKRRQRRDDDDLITFITAFLQIKDD
jgi:hypothetical protein